MLEETEVAGAQPDRDLVAPSTKAFEDRYGVAVQSDLDELDTLLASSSGRKKLMQVAQQLFCPENVAFFDAYHELAELETAEERVEAAKELIDRFFCPRHARGAQRGAQDAHDDGRRARAARARSDARRKGQRCVWQSPRGGAGDGGPDSVAAVQDARRRAAQAPSRRLSFQRMKANRFV